MQYVAVTNAPGYADFRGRLIREVDAIDDRGPLSVIAVGPNRGIAVVPSGTVTYVKPTRDELTAQAYVEEWATKSKRHAAAVYLPQALRVGAWSK